MTDASNGMDALCRAALGNNDDEKMDTRPDPPVVGTQPSRVAPIAPGDITLPAWAMDPTILEYLLRGNFANVRVLPPQVVNVSMPPPPPRAPTQAAKKPKHRISRNGECVGWENGKIVNKQGVESAFFIRGFKNPFSVVMLARKEGVKGPLVRVGCGESQGCDDEIPTMVKVRDMFPGYEGPVSVWIAVYSKNGIHLETSANILVFNADYWASVRE